jgi:hypothetical protein
MNLFVVMQINNHIKRLSWWTEMINMTLLGLKICDIGILMQLLCFCILSIILYLFQSDSVLETGLYLHLQVKHAQ